MASNNSKSGLDTDTLLNGVQLVLAGLNSVFIIKVSKLLHEKILSKMFENH